MITVRLATLSDTAAITEIHKSHRITPDGPRYEDLTLYERWQAVVEVMDALRDRGYPPRVV